MAGVSKWYQPKLAVLNQVSFQLNKGDFLYLVGGSGAGKTTLLRLLMTAETASMGELSLFGYSLKHISSQQLRSIRRLLGYIPQRLDLISDLSVFDNVALSLTFSGRKSLGRQARSQVLDILSQLGLERQVHQPAGLLSGGEAQRVAVARALVRSPELILADEPTGAQSRDERWALMELFLKLNRAGTTLILATHDRELVRRVRRRCAVLCEGNLSVEESLCTF